MKRRARGVVVIAAGACAAWLVARSPARRANDVPTRAPVVDARAAAATGAARIDAGDFLGALAPLRAAVLADSLRVNGPSVDCVGCVAMRAIVSALQLADSSRAAERELRAWTDRYPRSAAVWRLYAETLAHDGHLDAAVGALRTAGTVARSDDAPLQLARLYQSVDRYGEADAILREQAAAADVARRVDVAWLRGLGRRQQGRLREAYAAARLQRALEATRAPRGAVSIPTTLEAQTLLDMGRARDAAAAFDSIAHADTRTITWAHAHVASALAEARDTTALAALVDTVRASGTAGGIDRDRRLHHYVAGLLWAARGDHVRAVAELRASVYSLPAGLARIDLWLGRELLAAGRPRDAIAPLQSALRGALEGPGFYVTRAELHEALARAWIAADARDSAVAHYTAVANLWAVGDPPLAARAAAARARATALGTR